MDANINLALRQCIKVTLPKLTEPLPCPASTFLSQYLQQSRPFGSPSLDLKRSSHKTLAKLLKVSEKDGLLKFKDVKGNLIVISVDANHADIKDHKPFKSIGEADAKERAKVQRAKEVASRIETVEIRELWRPSGTVVALFEELHKE